MLKVCISLFRWRCRNGGEETLPKWKARSAISKVCGKICHWWYVLWYRTFEKHEKIVCLQNPCSLLIHFNFFFLSFTKSKVPCSIWNCTILRNNLGEKVDNLQNQNGGYHKMTFGCPRGRRCFYLYICIGSDSAKCRRIVRFFISSCPNPAWVQTAPWTYRDHPS